MGLLKFLFGNLTMENYTPDFNLTEYDNRLDFLSKGGTSEQWKDLKKRKQWKFKKDDTEIFIKYQKEVKPISDKYFSLMQEIESNWSALYNLGDYTGKLAIAIEKKCLEDISLYKKMKQVDNKYGEVSPTNIPAFKRLAMLYEKQGKFEESANVCKQAFSLGMDERGRMVRMIKKVGRKPNQKELDLINME